MPPHARTRDDLLWQLQLRYVAGGAAWRRVRCADRPWLWLVVSRFDPPATSWLDLEHLNFWNVPPPDGWTKHPAGSIDVDFYPHQGSSAHEEASVTDFDWRVVARNGHWFTVELAALTDRGLTLRDLEPPQAALVTTAGTEERPPRDAEWWRKNVDVYLVDAFPFGTVTVRVPRNARHTENYAIARAQELIGGLPAPEFVRISDFSKWDNTSADLHDDIYVELHFFGYYED